MEKIAAIFISFAFALIFAAILAYPTMLLWNWLIPSIFGLRTISYLEAFGLIELCSVLFQSSNSSKN